jgi:hypothetical protein
MNLFIGQKSTLTLLMYILSIFSISSCNQITDYKIVSKNGNHIEVSLPRRMSPDTLMLIAEEVKHLLNSEDNGRVTFVIPSEYKYEHYQNDSFLSSWAFVHFFTWNQTEDRHTMLRVCGCYSDNFKRCFLNIGGNANAMIGKWHHAIGVNEAVIIIEKQDSAFLEKRYVVLPYDELDGKPEGKLWETIKNSCEHNDTTIQLFETKLYKSSNPNHFKKEGDIYDIYRILPNGDLELLISGGSVIFRRVK